MSQEDFGFNNDLETALENGDIFVLSNYRILPNAGGWNDQYRSDIEDLFTYLKGLAWARSLKDEDREQDTEVDGDTAFAGFATKEGGVAAFK